MEDTVTISLKKYEDMQNEITSLKEELKEKTIVKYLEHPFYEKATIILVIAAGYGFILYQFIIK